VKPEAIDLKRNGVRNFKKKGANVMTSSSQRINGTEE